MNNFDEKVQAVREELDIMIKQFEYIKSLSEENRIEQSKIVEQNITIKHQIEELTTSQKRVDTKESELNEREKQILIKEKSLISSNRLLDEKLLDFRKKTIELSEEQKKLQKRLEEFSIQKKLVDQQTLINKKLEETDILRKNKLKLREDQVDRELERLKSLQL